MCRDDEEEEGGRVLPLRSLAVLRGDCASVCECDLDMRVSRLESVYIGDDIEGVLAVGETTLLFPEDRDGAVEDMCVNCW